MLFRQTVCEVQDVLDEHLFTVLVGQPGGLWAVDKGAQRTACPYGALVSASPYSWGFLCASNVIPAQTSAGLGKEAAPVNPTLLLTSPGLLSSK